MDSMDIKSKIFLGTFALVAMISIVATHYRYIIIQDIDFYTDAEAFDEALLEE